MKSIKNIKIFTNKTNKSEEISKKLKKLLIKYDYNIVNDNYELAIAIGGDGSFLKMIKENHFNSDIFYIGINTGTLGFLQEIKPNEIENFVNNLSKNLYKIDKIGVLETKIVTKNGIKKYYSLNEMVIRELSLNVFISDVYINNNKLETFAGDGLLLSTSIGSSAYNVSFNGALVYDTLHTLQLTPIAPITTNIYRNLKSSLILPENKKIILIPKTKNIISISDGENDTLTNVSQIEFSVKNKKLKFLRMKKYEYVNIINEKFIKSE